jgi:hypothetical protein
MGYELIGPQREFRFNMTGWPSVLQMAESHGWMPLGTKRPQEPFGDSRWGGSYYTNDGQIVTPEDAAALGDALTRALPDLQQEPTALQGDVVDEDPDEVHAWRGNRQRVADFIAFCREGGFEIS